MVIDIDQRSLKHGLLGLVIALVEIIKEALKLQAVRRLEAGGLTEEEAERLGEALLALDEAIEELKQEQGVAEAVKSVRDGLDGLVEQLVDRFLNPEGWAREGHPTKLAPQNLRFCGDPRSAISWGPQEARG